MQQVLSVVPDAILGKILPDPKTGGYFIQACDEDTLARLLWMQNYQQTLPSLFTPRSCRKGVVAAVSVDITSGLLSLVGDGT